MKNYIQKMTLATCLFLAATFHAKAQQGFSEFIAFGDSLSDSGQLFDPQIMQLTATPVTLRFTTRETAAPTSLQERVWTQNLSLSLGLGDANPSLPYLSDLGVPVGTNYAVSAYKNADVAGSILAPNGNYVLDPDLFYTGGAGDPNGNAFDFLAKGTTTRDGYLVENPSADPNALYSVWSGGNDIRAIRADGTKTIAQMEADAEAAAVVLVDAVKALAAAGAKHIIVPTLPDIGEVPESAALGKVAEGTAATRAYNAKVDAELAAAGLSVIRVDIFVLMQEMQADPAAFGLSAEDHSVVAFDGAAFSAIPAVEGANGQTSGAPDASKYLFFDGVHPSAVTHEVIADYVASVINAPAVTGAMAEFPLTLSRAHGNQLERHFASMKRDGAAGEIVPFISGGRGSVDGDRNGSVSDWDGNHDGVAVGASYRISENFSLGVAVGSQGADIDVDDLGSEIEVEGDFFSLTSVWRSDSIFANASLTFGSLDYETDRNVQIGALSRTHSGDTDGDYLGFQLTVGCDLSPIDGLTLSPYMGVRYEDVDVDAYSEDGAASSSLNYSDQDREALLLNIGVDAEYEMSFGGIPARLIGGIRYEQDIENDDVETSVGLNSAPGSRFSLDPYEVEDDAFRFDAGVQIELTERVDLEVLYVGRIADDTDDHSVNVSLSLAF